MWQKVTFDGMIWLDLVWEYVCRVADRDAYFNIRDLGAYYEEMAQRKPGNPFIAEKVRQQLQILRDRGFVEFISRGSYKRSK